MYLIIGVYNTKTEPYFCYIPLNSVAKTCYTDLLFRENKMAVQDKAHVSLIYRKSS